MAKSKKAWKKKEAAAKRKAARSQETSKPRDDDSDTDSDTAVIKMHEATSKKAPKKQGKATEDDSDTDSDVTVINMATPKKVLKKQDKATEDDSDTDSDVTAINMATSKKAPKKQDEATEDDSDMDSDVTVINMATPEKAPKRQDKATEEDSDTDSDVTVINMATPKKAPKRQDKATEEDSDTDSDVTVINMATPKKAPKKKNKGAKKKAAQAQKTSQPRKVASDSDSNRTLVDNTSVSCKIRLSLVLPPLESSSSLATKPLLDPSAFSEYCNMCKSLATRSCPTCHLVSYCDEFCEQLDEPQHKKLCKHFIAGKQHSDDKRPSPAHRRLLHLQYQQDDPQLFWAKTNLSQTQDTDISGVEVSSKSLRRFIEESGTRQLAESEAYCRITDENDPLSVLVVYSLKDPCKPGQPADHVNRTVGGMAEMGLICPMIGPLIVFACVRTAGGATRMVDIMPRDIRRVTAFFTMYRAGNPSISTYSGLYPFRSVQGVMISRAKDPYALELAKDDYTRHTMKLSSMDVVTTPIDSPHSSYPVSMAFAVGLPWYIRRIWPMGNDAEWTEDESFLASSPQPLDDVEGPVLDLNCLTPLKWLRHFTYKEKETGRWRSRKTFFRGSAVILNGNLHHITKRQLWCFHRYLDDCLYKGTLPSEDGCRSFWTRHSDGRWPSPYDQKEVLGGQDVFNPDEQGQVLRRMIRQNVARCWVEAKSDYSKGGWLEKIANTTEDQINSFEAYDKKH